MITINLKENLTIFDRSGSVAFLNTVYKCKFFDFESAIKDAKSCPKFGTLRQIDDCLALTLLMQHVFVCCRDDNISHMTTALITQ